MPSRNSCLFFGLSLFQILLMTATVWQSTHATVESNVNNICLYTVIKSLFVCVWNVNLQINTEIWTIWARQTNNHTSRKVDRPKRYEQIFKMIRFGPLSSSKVYEVEEVCSVNLESRQVKESFVVFLFFFVLILLCVQVFHRISSFKERGGKDF